MAEFRQALAHHALRQELRNEKRDMIRLGRSRICHLDRDRILETAVITILALRRIDAAGRDDAVEDAQILENLLTARLDTLAARSPERTVQLLDDAERHLTARKLDSERQPGGPCAADQDIGVECFGHGNLGIVCIIHISSRLEWRQGKKCIIHILTKMPGKSTTQSLISLARCPRYWSASGVLLRSAWENWRSGPAATTRRAAAK